MDNKPDNLRIAVVGPCAAGKTTLIARLRLAGYNVRHVAQEHSYVPYMWQRIANPDLLIFLDVSYPTSCARRQLNWTVSEYAEQQRRLQHAREHAHIIIDTDPLSPESIYQITTQFIETSQV